MVSVVVDKYASAHVFALREDAAHQVGQGHAFGGADVEEHAALVVGKGRTAGDEV